ncbi:MAG TPA: amino acid deaminase/aldolase [Thermoleophilaceae bacterium]|jgi:D-serine deaminase-like pyridoxal phosphate-dependent protein|nr:amino acid deaminase/aldolase [Thermoleophilaceae bacterium]
MAVHRTEARERTHEELERIFEEVDAPFALVDLDAMWANGEAMLQRAAGTPIRVASKSVRCRPLLAAILERDPGFRGLMTFTLPESLWLNEHGFHDLLLAYPTVHREALAELGRVDGESPPIVMVDSVEQLDLIEAAVGPGARPIRVCVELDVGWWPLGGRVKIGAKRSPIRTPRQAQALAREIVGRPAFELAALMGYEAHIAGLGDEPLGQRARKPAIRLIKRRSAAEIAGRRAAVVAAVREVAPVPIVNGGGTGSIHTTRAEDVVTEVTAGSGFYAPTLFDRYSSFTLQPAAMFAMPVVRRPSRSVATLLGGGYPASGAAGPDRLPTPHLPPGLSVDPLEGAGEVQTPVTGPAAASLRVGANVYLRHAKAGELCERFNTLYLISAGAIVDEVPTYRGEGRCAL